VTHSLFLGKSLATVVEQKPSKAAEENTHLRLDKLTSQGMLQTYVADNEQLTQKRTGGIPAGNKRTSRRRLQTYATDNQQLTHRRTGEIPALDKRLAVA
jgi:hypothetical protein